MIQLIPIWQWKLNLENDYHSCVMDCKINMGRVQQKQDVTVSETNLLIWEQAAQLTQHMHAQIKPGVLISIDFVQMPPRKTVKDLDRNLT